MFDKIKNSNIRFNSAALNEGKMYVSLEDANGLLEIDLNTYKAKLKAVFDTDEMYGIYNYAISINNEVWFIPKQVDNDISIYNVDTDEFSTIQLPKSNKKCSSVCFLGAYQWKGSVWLIPAAYEAFVKITINTHQIERVNLDLLDYKGMEYFINIDYFVDDVDGVIYTCPWNCNKVFALNMDDASVITVREGLDTNTYGTVWKYKERLFFAHRLKCKQIDIIDLTTNQIENIDLKKYEIKSLSGYYDNKKMCYYFLPYGSQKIYVMNMHDFSVELKIVLKENYENCKWCRTIDLSDYAIVIPEGLGNNRYFMIEHGNLRPVTYNSDDDLFLKILFGLIERRNAK